MVTEWQGLENGYRTTSPDICAKVSGRRPDSVAVVLTRRMNRLPYRDAFTMEGAGNAVQLSPGRIDWLDWDYSGRLVALAGGRAWAASVKGANVAPFEALIDLSADRFREAEAPVEALHSSLNSDPFAPGTA